MKKTFFFLLLSSGLFLTSCSSESSAVHFDSNNLIANWTLESSTGGIAGKTETPETSGITRKIVFTKEKRMIIYVNDAEVANYKYITKSGKSIYDNEEHLLIYAENSLLFVVLELNSNKLELGDNNYDGFVSTYKK
jgi:hypothetical protein